MKKYTARQYWKKMYRAMRVARREARKATLDMMIYGTGAVMIPSNGDDPKRIPLADIMAMKDLRTKLLG